MNQKGKFDRSDLGWSIFIPIVLFLFYPEIFLSKMGPLIADHWEQHYPWAFIFSGALKQGALPFWTPAILCGFPLASEGQIGVFYLPNLLLYSFLPLNVAYAYMYVFHFLVAGWGAYAFLRQMRLIPSAAFVGAMTYLFGASYGGGFYNITSLKTLAWFPVILFVFERFYASRERLWLLLLPIVISFILFAGYLQMAVLALLVFMFYVVIRICFFGDCKGRSTGPEYFGLLLWIGAACVGGFLIAAPQLYLTRELALLSNRAIMVEGYAYVGSMSPGAFVTILFPVLQSLFRGNSFYMGVFSFFLLCFALISPKTDEEKRFFRLWGVMIGIAALLALGQWSPLYVGLIKLTRFYAFRFPSKFLIFICFGYSMLCALGFQKAWLMREQSDRGSLLKKSGKLFVASVGGLGLVVSAAYFMLVHYRESIVRIGCWLVERLIFQKPGHPHSLEVYRENVNGLVEHALRILSFENPMSRWSYGFLTLGIVFAILLFRRKVAIRAWLIAGLLFLAADLYVFSRWDFLSDFDRYANLQRKSAEIGPIKEEVRKSEGRLYGFRGANESLPVVPSANMLYGIEDIGGYSPLVSARYYETIGLFGNVNDSNFARDPDVNFVLQRLNLLSALDVGCFLSTRPLDHPSLKRVDVDPAATYFLYRNLGDHARAFFVTHVKFFKEWESLKKELLAPGFDPQKMLLLEDSENKKLGDPLPGTLSEARRIERRFYADGAERWELTTTGPGFFVLSNVMYPGWEAVLDGQKVPILSAYGIFQAVWIPRAGEHSVELMYHPFSSLRQSPHSLDRRT